MLEKFHALLDAPQRILLTTHEHPDADAVGSLVALSQFLKSKGKTVRVRLVPNRPDFLAFIDTDGDLIPFDAEKDADLANWAEVWIVLDASEPKRLGPLENAFSASKALKLCLDHHLKTENTSFDFESIDSSASSTAERVYDFIRLRAERPLPPNIAKAIYAGLVDDTGNFRFSNASAKAHRMAAELIEDGIDPSETYQALYHQGRPQRLQLLGQAFAGLCMMDGGRYARIQVSDKDLQALSANKDDMEGLVNKPLELKGVEVACLLYETADGLIKASLRSRSRVDVNAVCRKLGGGGHRLASGVKLQGPLDHAQELIDMAVLAQIASDIAAEAPSC